ncbi:lytic transglycosylase domain-containing protein [Azospirillum sp. TSO22-1]|uniref:lytic transglycosylase domain-containing protein n=1 Tax=Azospirillum sp. TSO22-1 TaxID=716789 RepID=UPI000D6428F7|nr:lytic transglycosylase domain-containing protein [Azospirillum sp. TSO22-1]
MEQAVPVVRHRKRMKVAQPTVAPIPERKPEPPATAGASSGAFQAALADLKAVGAQKAQTLSTMRPTVPLIETSTADAGRIVQASRSVAGLSGHSYAAILAQATQESGLDAAAKNRTSSAAGPFQFLERTWLDLFRRHGSAYGLGDLARQIDSRNGIPSVKSAAVRKQILDLRHDVDISAGMAGRYLSEGRERLEKRLKRPVTEAESRIAYVMGVGGAAKLIRTAEVSPGAQAAELLPGAAKANKNLFYDRASGRALSAQETVARLTDRMENQQRAMFAAITQPEARRQLLDGGANSPLGSFRTTDSGEVPDDEPLG